MISPGQNAKLETARSVLTHLHSGDATFLTSLLSNASRYQNLTPKQEDWVDRLTLRGINARDGIVEPRRTVDVGSFEGVIGLFNTAKEHLKFPKISLMLNPRKEDEQAIVLSLAGQRSKNAGSVYITDGRPYGDNKYFGRISPDGKWDPSRQVEGTLMTSLVALLTALGKEPAKVAGEHGRLMGNCCFCRKGLTDERSTMVGYGPVCAENYGLPWG